MVKLYGPMTKWPVQNKYTFMKTYTGYFVMVPLHLACLQCLQHSLFEHLFDLYYNPIVNYNSLTQD